MKDAHNLLKPLTGRRVIANSQNSKTGPCATTYGTTGDTCPPDCPLLGNGCYAERGRVALHNRKAQQHADNLAKMNGAPLVRWDTSGDSFRKTKAGKTVLDKEYVRGKMSYHRFYKYSIGWGYTHRWESWDKAELGPQAWPANFSTLASVESVAEMQAAQSAGWRTARVIDDVSEKSKTETLCPFDLAKRQGKKTSINCGNCRLCFPGKPNNIAFLKH